MGNQSFGLDTREADDLDCVLMHQMLAARKLNKYLDEVSDLELKAILRESLLAKAKQIDCLRQCLDGRAVQFQ